MVALTLKIQDAQDNRQHFHSLCEEEGLSGDGWIQRILRENKLPRRISKTIGSRLLRWFATMLVTINLRLHAALGKVDSSVTGMESFAGVGDAGEPVGVAAVTESQKKIRELESELQSKEIAA